MLEKQSYSILLKWDAESYESEKEAFSAAILTLSQQKFIKNLIVSAAQEKLQMPATEEDYMKKQEYLRGQLDILTYQLAASDSSKEKLASSEQVSEE